jgi:hypothetical protein
MKQFILEEQWNEITIEQQNILSDKLLHEIQVLPFFMLSIGQMIEFLKDDLERIAQTQKGWHIRIFEYEKWIIEKELCDALWEATKRKLQYETIKRMENFSNTKKNKKKIRNS